MSAVRDEVSLHIDAPPERVWRMVTDVTRMGEWSPACYRCEWVGEPGRAEVGARFKGYNRQGPARWWTVCEVKAAEPGKVFEFATVDGTFSQGFRGREMTRWRYDFEPDGIGTKVTESYELVAYPWLLRPASFFLRRQTGMRRDGMLQTLERLRASAESADAG